MKFKTLINLLEDIESKFFVDGMNIDIDRVNIRDNKQYITLSLEGKLGLGRITVLNEEDSNSFEWDGNIEYRPSLFRWDNYDNGWMSINIYR